MAIGAPPVLIPVAVPAAPVVALLALAAALEAAAVPVALPDAEAVPVGNKVETAVEGSAIVSV